MKRRLFLSKTSVAGMGLLLSTPLLTSFLSDSPELHDYEKEAILKFRKELSGNFEDKPAHKKMVNRLTMPSKIVNRKKTSNGFELTFKSSDNHVKIINTKGLSTVHVS